MAKNAFEDYAMESQSDISDTATKATSAVGQTILMSMPTGSHPSNRSRDKAEQFVWSVHIAVMMQLDMFSDKSMKIL